MIGKLRMYDAGYLKPVAYWTDTDAVLPWARTAGTINEIVGSEYMAFEADRTSKSDMLEGDKWHWGL